ncbi:MAG TPA: LptF/LptG family permease [Dissulfurispiraceae bacterium]|nr:LptF/LptG family permease [Dissulfurispiraceae bacterium]
MILRVQRMYIADFLKVLLVLTLGMSSLFGILSIIDKLEEFMPYRPAFHLLLTYALAGIPRYVIYFMPMTILLSSLFIFSQAVKRREIVAIKTSGGRMKAMLTPFVALGVLLTLTGFILGEFVVPVTAKKVRATAAEITGRSKKTAFFREGSLYIRGKDGSVVKISLFLPSQNISKGISIFKFNEEGLTERIDAETGSWENNAWKLRNIQVYDLATGKVSKLKEMVYGAIESPKIFSEDAVKVEEMTLTELIRYKNRLAEAGFRNAKLSVDLSSRLSYPIVNLFMLLLGISLSIGGEQKGIEKILRIRIHGTPANAGVLSAGLGLLISVFYWLGYSFTLSLGYSGTVPPIIAPWIVPVIFSIVSLYLYCNIPE